MIGFSFRSLTFTFLFAFLIWSSNFEACIARRRRHWRPSRGGTSSSLYKNKGKYNHGHNNNNNHNHHHGSSGSKTKPKSPPSHKVVVAPPPPLTPKPKEATPPSPPRKGNNNGGHSVTFNVLNFGAKGDGSTDDTKVGWFFSLNVLFVFVFVFFNLFLVFFVCLLENSWLWRFSSFLRLLKGEL